MKLMTFKKIGLYSGAFLLILFIADKMNISQEKIQIKDNNITISMLHIDKYERNIPSNNSNTQEILDQNWILRRNGVSGELKSFIIVASDGSYTYRFHLSSQGQDYGCIFTGATLNVRIITSRGDDVDNVPIIWKSPVGTGSFFTEIGTSFDIPLY